MIEYTHDEMCEKFQTLIDSGLFELLGKNSKYSGDEFIYLNLEPMNAGMILKLKNSNLYLNVKIEFLSIIDKECTFCFQWAEKTNSVIRDITIENAIDKIDCDYTDLFFYPFIFGNHVKS